MSDLYPRDLYGEAGGVGRRRRTRGVSDARAGS